MDRVTKPQKKMLITLLRETKFMEGKKEKEWYWEKIQAALNTIGPKKTIIQWKKCWRDMRLTTRKKLAELKRCQLAGGSPPPGIELNQEDNDIIEIVGSEYFYEEMNGELKPENFMSSFDYVPEHFCDAILTAAAGQQAGHPHMQPPHTKEQQQQHTHAQTQGTDHHGNDGENNEASGSSNHVDTHNSSGFQNSTLQNTHNGGEHVGVQIQTPHNNISSHGNTFHNSLHPHLLCRQQHAVAAMQRENNFEEKMLQLMQDVFPKRSKRRKYRDPDRLFLLSLYDEMKRIPEEIRLDVKSELIQVLKKYQKKIPSVVKQEKSHVKQSTGGNNLYQMPPTKSKYEQCDKEPHSPQAQQQQQQQQQHPRDTNVNVCNAPQQMSHTLFQMQKKYDDPVVVDKVQQQQQQQQNEQQRKHVEAVAVATVHQQQQQQHPNTHQQQQQQPPPPPPPTNEQQQQQQAHLHHAQLSHGILFPMTPQMRNEQPPTQPPQHPHAHNPHQQQQQQQPPQQQHPHQQQPTHHAPTIFGAAPTDRPAMTYDTVG